MNHDVNIPYIWSLSPIKGLTSRIGFGFRSAFINGSWWNVWSFSQFKPVQELRWFPYVTKLKNS